MPLQIAECHLKNFYAKITSKLYVANDLAISFDQIVDLVGQLLIIDYINFSQWPWMPSFQICQFKEVEVEMKCTTSIHFNRQLHTRGRRSVSN